jgi:hypothetical protein
VDGRYGPVPTHPLGTLNTHYPQPAPAGPVVKPTRGSQRRSGRGKATPRGSPQPNCSVAQTFSPSTRYSATERGTGCSRRRRRDEARRGWSIHPRLDCRREPRGSMRSQIDTGSSARRFDTERLPVGPPVTHAAGRRGRPGRPAWPKPRVSHSPSPNLVRDRHCRACQVGKRLAGIAGPKARDPYRVPYAVLVGGSVIAHE